MKTLAVLPALWLTLASAQTEPPAYPEAVPLWPQGAPGSEDRAHEAEKIDTGPGRHNVSNVHNPSITPFLPPADKRTGTAVLIAPGGGHRVLCLGHEGYGLGQWLADHGVAAFVMKNRLARDKDSNYTVDEHAMADTRRALRLIRSRAGDWQLDPQRIGVMGFSAGGELAALAAMASDPGRPDAVDPVARESCRPRFQALIYPGSSARFTVSPESPPVFIALGYHDRPDIAKGMAELYLKYKEAGIPAELHIYSNAGHGFGFRPDKTGGAARWPERFIDWLGDSNLLKQP